MSDSAVDFAAAQATAQQLASQFAQDNEDQYPGADDQEQQEAAVEEENSNKRKFDGDGDGDSDRPVKRANEDPAPQSTAADASGNVTEYMHVPKDKVGKIIGREGATIRELQSRSSTRIQVDHKAPEDMKPVSITGTKEQVELAKQLIAECMESEGTGMAGDVQESLECSQQMVGRLIGRGGETIRSLQQASQAHVTVDQNFPEGMPRKINISGKPDAVQRALKMVNELIDANFAGSAQSVIQKFGVGVTKNIDCPKALVGKVIGKGGETIKNLQRSSGASIQIDQNVTPCKITLTGPPSAVDNAARSVRELIDGTPGHGHGGPGFGGPRPFAPAYPSYGAPAYGAPYGGMAPPAYGGYYPPAGYGGYPPAAPAAYGGYGAYGAAAAADPYAAYGGSGYGGGAAGGGSAWSELQDGEGRPYYYNSQTGASQWEKPAEMR